MRQANDTQVEPEAGAKSNERFEIPSERDYQLMRQLVMGLIPDAERILRVMVGTIDGSGSRAELFEADGANVETSTGSTHLRSAHIAVLLCSVAAIDHMRSFRTILEQRRYIMSLATLTRGAVEAFGKAHYLLEADSAGELLRRHVNLGYMEMKISVKHSEFGRPDGQRVDGAEYLEGMRSLLDAKGLGPVANIGVTTLASDVLSKAALGAEGRAFYSQLSSVAHGETAGVTMFLNPASQQGLEFVHRRSVIIPYAGMLFAACRLVINEIIEHFGVQPAMGASWAGALGRAEPWLVEIRQSDADL